MPILVFDDEPDVRRMYAQHLSSRGLVVREALVCELEDAPSGHPVFITGKGKIAGAMRARNSSVCEYVDHSAGPEGLLRELRDLRTQEPTSSFSSPPNASPPHASPPTPPPAGTPKLIAESPHMRALHQRLSRLADVDSTVLITGESGTGKETIARELFRTSQHRRREFVPVNCGAIPEGLIESELFGHKRGGFTGAVADHEGMVRQAEQGILFLDEIGEMPLSMQVRLLRFLDSGEYRRVGDPTIRRADVRIVAATNRSLERDVAAGLFRLDLFYRLSVVTLHVPPLRERREDIAPLAHSILRRIAPRLRTRVRAFSDDALVLLQNHPWPGNVRELQNVIECAAISAATDTIQAEELREVLTGRQSVRRLADASNRVDDLRMADVLAQFDGNQSRAAEALGINRTTLWRRQRRMTRNAST